MRSGTMRRARKSEAGSALVEFALILPAMIVMLAGIIDYALYIQAKMQVQEQAAAGAAFGAIPGNQNNLSMMQFYASYNSSGSLMAPVTSYTATATNIFTCTAGGASVSYNSSCASNPAGTPIEYVKVQTQGTFNALWIFPGIPATMTLTGSATYRVPWCAVGASCT